MSETVDRDTLFGESGGWAERIAPGYFPAAVEKEHVARYGWASRWCRDAFVLDVACGTGYGTRVLSRVGARTVGVDMYLPALRFGRDRFGATAVQADAHRLPFHEGRFDVVVSLETIEHLDRPEEFLSEVVRALRPGGWFLVSTPNPHVSHNENPHHIEEFESDHLIKAASPFGLRLRGVYGQHWILKGSVFRNVRGFRRAAWMIRANPAVRRFPSQIADPEYWCLAFSR